MVLCKSLTARQADSGLEDDVHQLGHLVLFVGECGLGIPLVIEHFAMENILLVRFT